MIAALRDVVGSLEDGVDANVAALRLIECEWEAFGKGQRIAGEIAFARQRLVSGDRGEAITLLRRVIEGRPS